MHSKVIFLPSDPDFSRRDKRLIVHTITEHTRRAVRALALKRRRFTWTVYPWQRDGVGAFTQTVDWVRITINPKQFARAGKQGKEMIERLIYIVYHELHHAARGYAGFLPKKRHHILMNCIFSEGLADTFAREQHPSPYVKKRTAYNLRQVRKWLPRIKKIKWQRENFEEPWLMGGQGKPRMLGYKLGRYLMAEVKRRNPRLNAAKLVRADAKTLLRRSGAKI